MSRTLARECCKKFAIAMQRIYINEYLRLPSNWDLTNISALHFAKHEV
jgi:hypothetical protein